MATIATSELRRDPARGAGRSLSVRSKHLDASAGEAETEPQFQSKWNVLPDKVVGAQLGESRYPVRTLERALDILELFTRKEPAFTLSEIALRVDLAKSTTLRFVSVLVERGFLERSPGDDRYRIGLRAFELGQVYIRALSLEREAQPLLRRLAKEAHQTANLGILDGNEVSHIAVVPPDRPIRFHTEIGERGMAHCAGLGKALLAFRSPQELESLLAGRTLQRQTEHTIASVDALLDHLSEVRRQGYAIDNEEYHLGLKCIAAPVFDASNRAVAAISVAGPAGEFDTASVPCLAGLVTAAALELSARLGYRPDALGSRGDLFQAETGTSAARRLRTRPVPKSPAKAARLMGGDQQGPAGPATPGETLRRPARHRGARSGQ